MTAFGSSQKSASLAHRVLAELELIGLRTPWRTKVMVVTIIVGAILLAALLGLGLDLRYMSRVLPILVATVPLVLFITLAAFPIAVGLGLLAALGSLSSRAVPYGLATFYISYVRGVPFILILFVIYFGLPKISLWLLLSPVQAGIIALGLEFGAWLAEVFRASILAVPGGQWEAGRSLNMSHTALMRRIILPQAARTALPPTTNYFLFMLKDSSVVSFIGVYELFGRAVALGVADFKIAETMILAAAIYFLLTMVFTQVQRRFEAGLAKTYSRSEP